MKISVKFSCPEILSSLKNGIYDVPEGTSIRELLSTCEMENNTHINERYLKWLLIIMNGRQSNWSTILSEGSKVSFLRGALGG